MRHIPVSKALEIIKNDVPKQILILKEKNGPTDDDINHANSFILNIVKDPINLITGQNCDYNLILGELCYSLAVLSFDINGIKFLDMEWKSNV